MFLLPPSVMLCHRPIIFQHLNDFPCIQTLNLTLAYDELKPSYLLRTTLTPDNQLILGYSFESQSYPLHSFHC